MKFLKNFITTILKILKIKRNLLVTHSGHFHADDVFAAAALSIFLKNRVKIVRTRDENIIAKGDYVFDVGGVYDPEKNRFDHHQKGGAGARPNGIPYASFGLVWKHYGEALAGSQEVSDYIDKILAAPIDALDNGIMIAEPVFPDIYPYDIGSFFDTFLPSFKEKEEKIDKIFKKVVNLAKNILLREIKKRKEMLALLPEVQKIYEEAKDKRIIVFNKKYPVELLANFPEPLFVVMPRQKDWLVLTVRDKEKSFKNRKDLPSAWAGLVGEDLAKVSGVPDALFCHNNLFIAVAASKEGAIRLAEAALA